MDAYDRYYGFQLLENCLLFSTSIGYNSYKEVDIFAIDSDSVSDL